MDSTRSATVALGGMPSVSLGMMGLLIVFFIIHMLMIFAAGPINELRSIITGWYRTDPPAHDSKTPERSA